MNAAKRILIGEYRLKARVCLLLAALLGNPVQALELELTGSTGIDTNPLILSDPLDPETDLFFYGDVNLSHDFDRRVFVEAYTRQTLFVDDDRADWSRSKLDLAYKSKFDIGERRFRYELSADLAERDKTYVSKTTGEEATFGGESIADRYDYTQRNYKGTISYRDRRRIKYKLEYQLRDKDYEDFTSVGLSDFDYEHTRLRFSLDYPLGENGRLVGRIGDTDRDFKDKRIDDLEGDDIAGTDLEYDYDSYELDYYYRPSDDFRFRISLDYVTRSDNGVGYADSTREKLFLSMRFRLTDAETLEVKLQQMNYEYDNRDVFDEISLEEEDNARDIKLITLEYEKILSSEDDRELAGFIRLKIEDAKSADDRYAYDRTVFTAGLRYAIE